MILPYGDLYVSISGEDNNVSLGAGGGQSITNRNLSLSHRRKLTSKNKELVFRLVIELLGRKNKVEESLC